MNPAEQFGLFLTGVLFGAGVVAAVVVLWWV
jgi:hypothetical protein